LIWSLSGMAARAGWPVYLLGGAPGMAQAAARELRARWAGLDVCGVDAPPYGFDRTAEGRERVRRKVVAAGPALVFVGLGFPQQGRLVAGWRREWPEAWLLGCGAARGCGAGAVRRGPEWMRRGGLEWAHRLMTEPRRLARRYLVDDLPFAARLLAESVVRR